MTVISERNILIYFQIKLLQVKKIRGQQRHIKQNFKESHATQTRTKQKLEDNQSKRNIIIVKNKQQILQNFQIQKQQVRHCQKLQTYSYHSNMLILNKNHINYSLKELEEMIGDNPKNVLSILKSSRDFLIFKSNNKKFVCKTYYLEKKQMLMNKCQFTKFQSSIKLISQSSPINQIAEKQIPLIRFQQSVEQTLKNIQNRQKIKHNNVIQFNLSSEIEKISQQKYFISIIHEHYCKLLEQCFSNNYQQIDFDDYQIINTFQPIIQVVEYFIKQKYPIYQFSPKNIAITQDQTVKFIENFLLEDKIQLLSTCKKSYFESGDQIYQQIASTIFKFIFPNENIKSWKNKLKLIKQKRSKQMSIFLSMLLDKCSIKCSDIKKQKKIKKSLKGKNITSVNKKQNIQDVINTCNKDDNTKIIIDSIISIKHQGKQNKIYQ